MTRKTLCTSTLFVAALGVIAAGCVIQTPGDLWWDGQNASGSFPLILWVLGNIIIPVLFTVFIAVLLCGIWEGCSALCARLRVESK